MKLERQGFNNPSSLPQTAIFTPARTDTGRSEGAVLGFLLRGESIGEQQLDEWTVASGTVPRPPPTARDLSSFGKINKSGPVVMGPSSVWAGKKDTAKRDSNLPRVNSRSNMFTMLDRDGEVMPETSSQPSQQSRNRRTNVDLNTAGAPEPLQLLPWLKSLEEKNKVDDGSLGRSEY